MRTTVDLPEDLHAAAVAIARDTHRTLSETIANLMRRGPWPGAGRQGNDQRSHRPARHPSRPDHRYRWYSGPGRRTV